MIVQYELKSVPELAQGWTEDEMREIADWCGGTYVEERNFVVLSKYDLIIQPGDIIFHDPDCVYPDERFQKMDSWDIRRFHELHKKLDPHRPQRLENGDVICVECSPGLPNPYVLFPCDKWE